MPAKRSGIVTLTTDFGFADGFVGAMKGAALSLFAGVQLVDVAHDVPAFDVVAGALALHAAARHFPAGTVHVAVVDPGVGGARAALAVESGGQLFIGPDNGLLELAAPAPRRVHRIEARPFVAREPAPTFHGRDVFVRCGALLAAGADVAAVGPEATVVAPLGLPAPVREHDAVAGRVIHVDRFGNLISSIPAALLPSGATWVWIDGRRVPWCSTFSDVAAGALLAYVGSSGFVEIAVREGRADELIQAPRGRPVRVEGSRGSA